MRCPRCDSQKTRVVDSREGAEGRSVRRRRVCDGCQFRFTTFESIEDSLPMVVKKGGQRESFDRYKILSGLKKACEKRPVSVLQMEDLVREVESILLETGEKEVSSVGIGELVIDKLRDLDQVAYVRFASVYREFSDVSEFIDALKTLMSKDARNSLVSAIEKRRQLYVVEGEGAKLPHVRKDLDSENSSSESYNSCEIKPEHGSGAGLVDELVR